MYQIKLAVQHDCPYLKIANLFDLEIFSYCSDVYDLMIIPKRLSKEEISQVKLIVDDPESLEIKHSENSLSKTYLYFQCMCRVDTSVSPRIQEQGGIVEHPIVYKDGWEHYSITSINKETQSQVLSYIQTIDNYKLESMENMGDSSIYKSQYISVHQLMQILTPRQIEVIVSAFENGYYQIPRKTKTEVMASEFGVSRPALEKSLRHAENKIMDIILPYLFFQNKILQTTDDVASLTI